MILMRNIKLFSSWKRENLSNNQHFLLVNVTEKQNNLLHQEKTRNIEFSFEHSKYLFAWPFIFKYNIRELNFFFTIR